MCIQNDDNDDLYSGDIYIYYRFYSGDIYFYYRFECKSIWPVKNSVNRNSKRKLEYNDADDDVDKEESCTNCIKVYNIKIRAK